MNKHVPEMYLADCYWMDEYIQAYEPRIQVGQREGGLAGAMTPPQFPKKKNY